MDRRGCIRPRHSSPIAEHQTFVIFDDARCRGADLKLRLDAVGLLTLGPDMCKDKLMQAAGQLRQLGQGQGLHFAASADVVAKICACNGLRDLAGAAAGGTPRAVLRWVMDNMVDATLHGVAHWASQGLHFTSTWVRLPGAWSCMHKACLRPSPHPHTHAHALHVHVNCPICTCLCAGGCGQGAER